jgi:hypothetical protein
MCSYYFIKNQSSPPRFVWNQLDVSTETIIFSSEQYHWARTTRCCPGCLLYRRVKGRYRELAVVGCCSCMFLLLFYQSMELKSEGGGKIQPRSLDRHHPRPRDQESRMHLPPHVLCSANTRGWLATGDQRPRAGVASSNCCFAFATQIQPKSSLLHV